MFTMFSWYMWLAGCRCGYVVTDDGQVWLFYTQLYYVIKSTNNLHACKKILEGPRTPLIHPYYIDPLIPSLIWFEQYV